MQLAETLSIPKLISLGYEMCGRYPVEAVKLNTVADNGADIEPSRPNNPAEAVKATSTHTGKGGSAQRCAITSAAKLSSFTHKAHGAHGSKNARRAAAYVIDGSASPMETAIVMELTLPYMLGGRAMPMPVLNHQVELSPEASILARRKHLVFDLFWPEHNLAVEYDSRMHHEGESARVADSRKRTAAAAMGIQVINITERQYLNMLEFEEIAKTIASKLGYRIRPNSPDYRQRVFKLRAELRHLYSNED